ncbi:nucleotide-binding alpha-beta plait domain-containing protein [Tanacetum coccineum]
MDFCYTPCVFLGYSPSYHGYRYLDISTERLYIARHARFNEAQFTLDIPKTTSPPLSKTSPYYSSESPYVILTTDHPSPSSPRSLISSPSSVSHLSPTSQTSPEFFMVNHLPYRLHRYPHHHHPHHHFPSLSNWRQAMKEEYDALMKNRTLSLVPRASNTNVVDGNNKGTIDNIISQLRSSFALKDLRPFNYFLGIEIVPHVSDILLSQKKYILELLQSVGLSNCNPVSSLMVTLSSLSLNDNTAFSNLVKYRQVVDADWTGDLDDRRSTRGFVIYLGLNLISRTTRKQHTVSRSSKETEYKAFADTVAELTWIQALLYELGICSSSTPIL